MTKQDASAFLDGADVVTVAWCQPCRRLVVPTDLFREHCPECDEFVAQGPRRLYVASRPAVV